MASPDNDSHNLYPIIYPIRSVFYRVYRCFDVFCAEGKRIIKNPVVVNTTGFSVLVEEGGFEAPKSETTDLQSAPFGHSGIPPYKRAAASGFWSWWTDSNPRPADYKSEIGRAHV